MGRLTEITQDGKRESRKMELDEKEGVVSWNVDRVLGIFGNPWHKVELKSMKVSLVC